MKKKINLSIVLVMTFILSIFLNSLNAMAIEGENLQQKVVLIDPGHGGIDGGAKAPDNSMEKDINLSISLLLKNSLDDKGYKVEMTRDSDVGLYEKGQTIREKKREDLANRSKKKSETNCDIFISIHQNMFPQAKCNGAQVWYASNDSSKKLADILQESYKTNVNTNNHRLAKPAGDQYRILRDNYPGAAVIFECGFLSNPEELSLLKTEEYQKKIVDSIVKGIEEYISQTNVIN